MGRGYTGRLGERLNEQLRIRVFSHMQRQGVGFYTEEKAGVLLTRMTSDIEALSMLFQEGIVNLLVQIFTLLVITAALFYYDPLLAVITLAVTLPPTLFTSLWFRKVSSVGYLRVRDRIADLLTHLQESLAGIRVIAAHNRRARNLVDHRAVVGEHLDAQVSTSSNSLYAPGTEMIGIATQATLLAVGGAMAASGRITVGELAAFLLFLASFFAPIQTLVQLYNSYQQGGAAIVKLRELLGTEPAIPQAPDATDLPPSTARSNSTGSRSVTKPIGRCSTMSRCASSRARPWRSSARPAAASRPSPVSSPAFTTPMWARCASTDTTCEITIDSLRSQLGVVPQSPSCSQGVVRDNVAFARPDADDAELQAALDAVGIGDLVERLGGLDAPVHERGASLSAGERQLLALARAFVARPRVLILDEATSNLDLNSETQVERSLDVVLEGRTAVIIAHRLATARRADRIAVVDDGRIVELGSHDELVAQRGRYAAMFETWVRHGGRLSDSPVVPRCDLRPRPRWGRRRVRGN